MGGWSDGRLVHSDMLHEGWYAPVEVDTGLVGELAGFFQIESRGRGVSSVISYKRDLEIEPS
jgi:hypothetical protein